MLEFAKNVSKGNSPGGQLWQPDCPDKDWKVPELQTAGSALPAGQAWPGEHWYPMK